MATNDQRGGGDGRTDLRPSLIVLGASVRGLAQSAARSGFAVHAADLFADVDCAAAAASVRRVGQGSETPGGYPAGLAAAAAAFPGGPWCYTGGLENHPDLIDGIARSRPLAGNDGTAVRRVRDPFAVARAVREEGLLFPETHADPAGLPTDGSFVVKPLAGAGGRGIRRWTPHSAAAGPAKEPVVWQRWTEGESCAAAFLLANAESRLLGLTRQLVGCSWCHAPPHAYCGSIVIPTAAVPAGIVAQIERLGSLLKSRFALAGLVGVDLVIDPGGRVVVIEVNPRPTASMELLERSTGLPLAAAHLAACGRLPSAAAPHLPRADAPAADGGRWSKAILFARRDAAITAGLCDRLSAIGREWGEDDWPAIADLPRPDQTIPAGGPVLTIFHRGPPSAAPAFARRETADWAVGVPDGLAQRMALIAAMIAQRTDPA